MGTINKYKKFIVNGILLITLFFIFDLVLGNALRHFYFKAKYGTIYHQTYSLDSTKADVIILGSSHAHGNYVPKIIVDCLDMTAFNTGMDGNYMLNSYAVYQSITKRYTPEIILMDIHPNEIFVGTGGYDQLSSLLPYYKANKEIRGVITLKSKFERIKLLSKIYPFNSALLAIGEGIIKTEDINELNGYKPLYGSMPDTIMTSTKEVGNELDSNKIKVLEAIASDCYTRHIRLIFIQSPMHTKVSQEKSVSIINDIATKYGAEFWNYVDDKKFMKPGYFKDHSHMNDRGATEFTNTICDRIKKGIK